MALNLTVFTTLIDSTVERLLFLLGTKFVRHVPSDFGRIKHACVNIWRTATIQFRFPNVNGYFH